MGTEYMKTTECYDGGKSTVCFRKADLSDLDEILTFVQASIEKMISEGIFQWDEIYPCRSDFEEDIRQGTLSVGIDEVTGKIASIYVLNDLYDEAYTTADWKYHGEKFRILHRIVVNPEFQHKGMGRTTMVHLMQELKAQGMEALRLDVFSENPYSQRLYDSLGFIRCGQAQWRKGLFFLLEKKLTE